MRTAREKKSGLSEQSFIIQMVRGSMLESLLGFGELLVICSGDFQKVIHKASTQQDLSAVTAACMMVKRSVYEEVGGFEEQLAVAFNDIDFCLKVRRCGYLVVYDPYVKLYHYESRSRGAEDNEEKIRRYQCEIDYVRRTWSEIMEKGDPMYNPNLTLVKCDYSLREKENG